jgi:hypothetical protein
MLSHIVLFSAINRNTFTIYYIDMYIVSNVDIFKNSTEGAAEHVQTKTISLTRHL